MKKGLLLINIGTPSSPDVPAVRRYLREFLSDKRVIDLPSLLRYILLYCVILPFRPKQSAHAYQAIWTANGSPLICYSEQLCNQLRLRLGKDYQVVLGMRYGKPSIQNALKQMQGCEHITVLPLYPQYSSAATGSSIEKALQALAPTTIFPSISIIRDFYNHPAFIHAQAELIKKHGLDHDHILFSYHGLPERHLLKAGCKTICADACPASSAAQGCYRAQCFETTRLLAERLQLTNYSTAFQSRLGKTPWIKPYTDEVLTKLVNSGVKRLAIACPSFVTDCLETLEEIGLRAKQQWLALGGEQFTLIPCLNDNELWIDAIQNITAGSIQDAVER